MIHVPFATNESCTAICALTTLGNKEDCSLLLVGKTHGSLSLENPVNAGIDIG